MKKIRKILSIFKKKGVYIPLIILAALIGGFTAWSMTRPDNYQTVSASKISFSEEVSVTGKVVAAEDVNLGFETGGKAASVKAVVGAKVAKGQLLAAVGSGSLYATVLDRQAKLQAARAELASLEAGTRNEELQITETSKGQAENALKDEIISSYVASDDAIKSDTDQFYTDADSLNPKLVSFNDYDKKVELEDKRVGLRYLLDDWKELNDQMDASGYKEEYLTLAKTNLTFIRDYLNDLVMVIIALEEDETMTDTEVSALKSALSSARSGITSSISSLNAAEKTFKAAKDQLALDEAGSTPEDLEIEQANVKSAQASLLQAQAELAKTSIFAPFEGTVTKVDLRIGEIVSANTPVVSMISSANFEIESFIPEADIAKITVGDRGTTTLDAYGDDVPFEVVVTGIDLSETEVEGVATYKTDLQFAAFDERIRSGMTANIDIISGTREGVLAIPQTALINKEGKRTILVRNEKGKAVSREIRTGSLDAEGNIEIVEGLSEGELVVINPLKK